MWPVVMVDEDERLYLEKLDSLRELKYDLIQSNTSRTCFMALFPAGVSSGCYLVVSGDWNKPSLSTVSAVRLLRDALLKWRD